MSENHTSSLQDTILRIIRQELLWSEQRFTRITMSEDASDNPAELYGADGKIYYRKAGGAGVEIGISAGGSHSALIQLDYASAGHTGFAGNPAVANQDMDHHTIYDSSDITLYDGSVISPELHFRVPLDEGFSGFKIDYHSDDAMLRFQDRATSTSVMTLSDDGKLVIWDDFWLVKGKEINFGTPNTAMIWQDAATEDLKFSDTATGTKTLSELLTGGGAYLPLAGNTSGTPMTGTLHMGGQSLSNAHIAGTNNTQFILDQDNTGAEQASEISFERGSSHADNARLKWSASNTRFDLMSTNSDYAALKVGSVDVSGYAITGFDGLTFDPAEPLPDIVFDTGDSLRYDCTTNTFEFLIGSALKMYLDTSGFDLTVPLDMNTHKIEGLVAGTVSGEAVEFSQLGTGVSKISNCPSTPVSVECKADCNIDITVPSGKVVTFIRS